MDGIDGQIGLSKEKKSSRDQVVENSRRKKKMVATEQRLWR